MARGVLDLEIPLATTTLIFILFTGVIQFENPNLAFGQSSEDSDTMYDDCLSVAGKGLCNYLYDKKTGQGSADAMNNGTDSSFSTTNSTASGNGHANIVLLSQKLKKALPIYIDRHVIGLVKNIGDGPATLLRADMIIYDKNGDIKATAWSYVQGDTLNPNQKSTFDIGTGKGNFKGMGHYEISLQWRNPDGTKGYVDNVQPYKDSTADTND